MFGAVTKDELKHVRSARRWYTQSKLFLRTQRKTLGGVGSLRSQTSRTGGSIPSKLVEREGKYPVKVVEVENWRLWARTLASAQIKNFNSLDGSPSVENLFREIDWLIEDNVAAIRHMGSNTFESKKGILVLREAKFGPPIDELMLRENLNFMGMLWKKRLVDRIPLQYLTNTVHWRDLRLTVSTSVLIPRPETELLLDYAREVLQELKSAVHRDSYLPEGAWIDLGTGSGALAISIAKELRNVATCPRVYATDISVEAAEIAKYNILENGVANIVTITTGSWFEPLDTNLVFSGILSNPPYIPTHKLASLQPEVVLHEPHIALDGGTNQGETLLINICKDSISRLLPGGFLALETHDLEQAKIVAEYLRNTACFWNIRVRRDYCGIGRFVTARKNM